MAGTPLPNVQRPARRRTGWPARAVFCCGPVSWPHVHWRRRATAQEGLLLASSVTRVGSKGAAAGVGETPDPEAGAEAGWIPLRRGNQGSLDVGRGRPQKVVIVAMARGGDLLGDRRGASTNRSPGEGWHELRRAAVGAGDLPPGGLELAGRGGCRTSRSYLGCSGRLVPWVVVWNVRWLEIVVEIEGKSNRPGSRAPPRWAAPGWSRQGGI